MPKVQAEGLVSEKNLAAKVAKLNEVGRTVCPCWCERHLMDVEMSEVVQCRTRSCGSSDCDRMDREAR